MVAEFYGLPGSGKTTLVNALTHEDSRIKKNRSGKSISIFQHIGNMLTPEFMGFAGKCLALLVAKKNRWKDDRKCVRMMLRLYLIYMWERENKPGEFRCHDHGLIQSILSLIWVEYDLGDKALTLADYVLRNMRSAMVMVYTRNPQPETVYDRMVQRGESRRVLRLLERPQAMELMAFQAAFFEKVCGMAEEYGISLPVNTLASVEENTEALKDGLIRRMK